MTYASGSYETQDEAIAAAKRIRRTTGANVRVVKVKAPIMGGRPWRVEIMDGKINV